MKFLCEHHRQAIMEHPDKALGYWRDWMDRGGAMIENGDWRRACPFLGCSFELAEWLLDNPPANDTHRFRAIDRYMIAGHQLAECLGRTGEQELELHFLLTVHLRLIDRVRTRQAQYWLLKQQLQLSLAMLTRYRQRRGSFRGYYDCCVETELYINQCLN